MSSFNQATIIGNLGKDPEVKSTQAGKNFINFSVATSKKYKKDGEWQEETQWHNVTVWREHTANFIGKYAQKGTKLLIVGELQTRKYQKEGVDHYATSIVVGGYDGDVKILTGGKTANQQSNSPDTNNYGDSGVNNDADLDDEIPF